MQRTRRRSSSTANDCSTNSASPTRPWPRPSSKNVSPSSAWQGSFCPPLFRDVSLTHFSPPYPRPSPALLNPIVYAPADDRSKRGHLTIVELTPLVRDCLSAAHEAAPAHVSAAVARAGRTAKRMLERLAKHQKISASAMTGCLEEVQRRLELAQADALGRSDRYTRELLAQAPALAILVARRLTKKERPSISSARGADGSGSPVSGGAEGETARERALRKRRERARREQAEREQEAKEPPEGLMVLLGDFVDRFFLVAAEVLDPYRGAVTLAHLRPAVAGGAHAAGGAGGGAGAGGLSGVSGGLIPSLSMSADDYPILMGSEELADESEGDDDDEAGDSPATSPQPHPQALPQHLPQQQARWHASSSAGTAAAAAAAGSGGAGGRGGGAVQGQRVAQVRAMAGG